MDVLLNLTDNRQLLVVILSGGGASPPESKDLQLFLTPCPLATNCHHDPPLAPNVYWRAPPGRLS
jgi:hypothetical protein